MNEKRPFMEVAQALQLSPAKAMNESIDAGFVPVVRSLTDLLGSGYTSAVSAANAFLRGADEPSDAAIAVDFYPRAMQARLSGLLGRVGDVVLQTPLTETPAGAGSATFTRATHTQAAPLSAFGYYRIGENGTLHLASKSEHYHTPLGHAFPGYALLAHARALGIPNATHNNTRGFITRLLEEELVRVANGLERGDATGMARVLSCQDDLYVLNRVLNLQTGSLAAEAALKLVLARFTFMEPGMAKPKYHGKVPVILVMGSDEGKLQANYHGTTVLTQMMRGMWPELQAALEQSSGWKIVAIRPNHKEDLDVAFERYERDRFKIAGFFHEIVMMNYGGRLLHPDFLHHAYALCQKYDVPTVVDEIQSCMWAPQLFMFREYGLRPSCLALGKGFPGGEYATSRLLFSSALDVMPQFGALVTNGQEELASLAYLITMQWAQANAGVTARWGSYFESRLHEVAAAFPRVLLDPTGWRHMTALRFTNLNTAQTFAKELNQRGLDVSAQTYKSNCPPALLFKLPLIADGAMIDRVVEILTRALKGMA